jgi:hypothetical protein
VGDYQSVLIILMFGVPLFDFVVLTAVFSHPVIRGLGVAVVDEDRSETSRAFIEQVAASPSLRIVPRTGDLASAARAIRSGDAIAAVYIPADFERDLKAERRPQVVAFYNQQYLTAAGVAWSGLSDSLSAAVSRAVARSAPRPSRIGSGWPPGSGSQFGVQSRIAPSSLPQLTSRARLPKSNNFNKSVTVRRDISSRDILFFFPGARRQVSVPDDRLRP